MSDSDSNGLNTMQQVEGAIDASWTSYGVPKQTADSEGTEETRIIPERIDKDDLTDLQTDILETAIGNPLLTVSNVAEKVGCSDGSVSNTLRKFVPEWYEGVFKTKGGSTDKGGRPAKSEAGESEDKTVEAPEAGTELIEEATKTDRLDEIKQACEVIQQVTSNNELYKFTEWTLEVIEE